MERSSIEILAQLNKRFYERYSESFSQTRQAPWAGWDRLAEEIGLADWQGRLSVLDVACGNMRFARFIEGKAPYAELSYLGIDSCEEMACFPEDTCAKMEFRAVDILLCELEGDGLKDAIGRLDFDLACSFGFMHHVPSSDLRERLIADVASHIRPGGWLVLSFWQFADDAAQLDKAVQTTDEVRSAVGVDDLDAGDFYLGWQGSTETVRYCHSFTDAEVDGCCELLKSVFACEKLVRYKADGKNGSSNSYVLAKRRAE